MPQKKTYSKASTWTKANDKKLKGIIAPENYNGDAMCFLNHNNEKIHTHWPHWEWKTLARHIRKNIKKWELDSLSGRSTANKTGASAIVICSSCIYKSAIT